MCDDVQSTSESNPQDTLKRTNTPTSLPKLTTKTHVDDLRKPSARDQPKHCHVNKFGNNGHSDTDQSTFYRTYTNKSRAIHDWKNCRKANTQLSHAIRPLTYSDKL